MLNTIYPKIVAFMTLCERIW